MSSSIIFRSIGLISSDNKVLVLTLGGDNNCTMRSYSGREVQEKHWYCPAIRLSGTKPIVDKQQALMELEQRINQMCDGDLSTQSCTIMNGKFVTYKQLYTHYKNAINQAMPMKDFLFSSGYSPLTVMMYIPRPDGYGYDLKSFGYENEEQFVNFINTYNHIAYRMSEDVKFIRQTSTQKKKSSVKQKYYIYDIHDYVFGKSGRSYSRYKIDGAATLSELHLDSNGNFRHYDAKPLMFNSIAEALTFLKNITYRLPDRYNAVHHTPVLEYRIGVFDNQELSITYNDKAIEDLYLEYNTHTDFYGIFIKERDSYLTKITGRRMLHSKYEVMQMFTKTDALRRIKLLQEKNYDLTFQLVHFLGNDRIIEDV